MQKRATTTAEIVIYPKAQLLRIRIKWARFYDHEAFETFH